MAKISGTKEWSVASVNCITGCRHACRYCYARANAMRFKQIETPEQWEQEKIRQRDVGRPQKKRKGRVMFPTAHDITPTTCDACGTVIANLLDAGNNVLVVSKPHYEVIRALCDRFHEQMDRVLFRFSIGAIDDAILGYWEPGAPEYAERVACLAYAFGYGFGTSVSAEPLLEQPAAVKLYDRAEPYVTDTIWFGCLNKLSQRVIPGTDPAEIARVEAGQTPEAIREVYELLKDRPKVRWKESYCSVLGIEQTVEDGR